MTVSRFDSKSWLLFAGPGLRYPYSAATPDVCPDALFVASDTFFDSRPVQFATLRRATGFRPPMRSVIMSPPAG
jgi:hypothetical protein